MPTRVGVVAVSAVDRGITEDVRLSVVKKLRALRLAIEP
jgi:hypothetical protein